MKEILKLALEALDTCMYPQPKQIDAIAALRLAIDAQNMSSAQVGVNPQYVAFMDVPFKRWVGLTKDEQNFVYRNLHNATSRKDSFWVDFANAIEAKLKEKNCG